MARKGLDTTFIHYGIRKPDMSLIEPLCTEHQLDFDWVKEDLLKEFHELRIGNKDFPPISRGSRTISSEQKKHSATR